MASVTEATVPEIPGSALETQPATEPEGLYEVVDGQVREKHEMGIPQIQMAVDFLGLLYPFVRSHGLGRVNMEMLYLLDRETNLQRRPDVAFVSADRWPLDREMPEGSAWDVVPDLAVEIISPTNRSGDDLRKIAQYFQAGVKQVWVVYPSVEQVYVYRSPTEVRILTRADVLDASPVMPGFQVSVNDLFGGK